LQEVISEVVVDTEYTKNRDGSMTSKPMERLGVYYSDIIPVLTKAIQEQQAMIDELKREVATLKAKK
jgi:polyhydroxyalkanoate synthesis regulator phasin